MHLPGGKLSNEKTGRKSGLLDRALSSTLYLGILEVGVEFVEGKQQGFWR